MAALCNYVEVTTAGGKGLTLNNLTSGGKLTLTGAGTAYSLGNANFGGTSDTVNLVLNNPSGAGVSYTSSGLTAGGVESLTIEANDTSASPLGNFNSSFRVLATPQSIIVAGNSGLILGAVSGSLKSVDASSLTMGGFTFATGSAVSGAVVVKGSASGFNCVDLTASSAAIFTYTGGTGNDIVVVGAGAHTISTGMSNDTVRPIFKSLPMTRPEQRWHPPTVK